jgi:hypothetical protein
MQANTTKCFEKDEGLNERQCSGDRMKLLTALIAVYLSTAPACAHDHNHPELKGWFEGLQSGRGMCCDGKDALHLSDVDWGWQNKEDSHIRVRVPKDEEFFQRALAGDQNIETVWVDVNDNAVIDEIPNKTGVPLVWPVYYPDINMIWIRCFMPGAGA